MRELLIDFLTSLDGYASATGWPGWWGLQGPEYLAWLAEQPERNATLLLGAKTYQLMSGFALATSTAKDAEFSSDERRAFEELTSAQKVVFSTKLQAPLAWANTELVSGDASEAVRRMKREGTRPLRTVGSISLCRSLLRAGLVDRFRVAVFPVITGATGTERIYDDYPDVALDMTASRTFDGRIQLLEYVPRVLTAPPGLSQPKP